MDLFGVLKLMNVVQDIANRLIACRTNVIMSVFFGRMRAVLSKAENKIFN